MTVSVLSSTSRFPINATDFSQKPKLEAVPVKAADAVLTDTTLFCLRNLTGGLPMKTAHIYSPGYALLAGLLRPDRQHGGTGSR